LDLNFLKQFNNTKKVFIPFKGYDFIGGPSTFMRNLKTYFDDVGYKYKSDISKSKHIFFPISYDLASLKKIKKDKGAIIQRLDGIYYPQKHGASYQEKNKLIKDIYLNYATKVVFQSQYSKAQCFKLFGEKDTDDYEIIINGVNEAIFYPSNILTKSPKTFKLVTTGNFRNIDMLEPVIKALDAISKFDFELNIIGPIVNDKLHAIINRDYINHLGSKDSHQIADLLREHHIFMYSHLNPPCPNSVLEAIASGLPVVGFNSGSMSELLHFSPNLLAEVSDDLFQKYEDFSADALKEKIIYCMTHFEKIKEVALVNASNYSFKHCGKQYQKIFQNIG
jgi:glycosyltransferase involved in cell wall biosynthesis